MSEYLELGPTPSEENCVQVGDPNYDLLSRKESVRYITQLEKRFPQYEKFRVRFSVMSFPHDFGYYKEVVVKYDPGISNIEFVYFVERNLPYTWNDESIVIMNKENDASPVSD